MLQFSGKSGKIMQLASEADVEFVSAERRRSRRYQVDWTVKIIGVDLEGGRFEEAGILQNLSSRGAFGAFTRIPRLGSRLKVSIQLPNSIDAEKWMKYSGEVLRIESHQWGIGVALRFVNARPTFALNASGHGRTA